MSRYNSIRWCRFHRSAAIISTLIANSHRPTPTRLDCRVVSSRVVSIGYDGLCFVLRPLKKATRLQRDDVEIRRQHIRTDGQRRFKERLYRHSCHLISVGLISPEPSAALWLLAATANWVASKRTTQFAVAATNRGAFRRNEVVRGEIRSDKIR